MRLLTPRDTDILQALERCPLTARQLLRLSETFASPFTTERKVRARMQILAESGRVCRWPYAIAGRGMPIYYTLTRQGYRLLYDRDAPPPAKRSFRAIGIAHQQHTFALAECIVQTAVAAHRSGIVFTNFRRENSVCLMLGDDRLYPDATWSLLPSDGRAFHFFVEVDNRSERIQSTKDTESWDRKIRFYEAFADQHATRFRVLVLAVRGTDRLTHILERAGQLARNPQRSLFYGIGLPQYLAAVQPLTGPCFLDHRLHPVALVPPLRPPAASVDRVPTGLLVTA